jgi:XRE family transcriptional regulator, regulator of sulfur utilization
MKMRAELAVLATSIGANVRQARTAAGLTQKRVADGCEMDVSYISGIENGRTLPSLKTIVKIAGVTGVTIEDLVKGLPTWNPPTSGRGAFMQGEER